MRTLRYRIYRAAWETWHMRLRKMFDYLSSGQRHWYGVRVPDGRPFWHLCCNGNAGGWRTRLCDHLEQTWRDLEDEQ